MRFTSWAKRGMLLLVPLSLTLGACDTFMDTTSVSDLETEVFQIKATLDQMGQSGTAIAELQLTADQSLVLETERNSAEATAFAAQATLTAMNRGGVPVQPNVAGGAGTMPGATPEPGATPPPASGTTFSDTTTTTGIRSQDGCAVDRTSVFNSTEDQIYVVTTLTNLKAGAVFGVRWFANGVLFHEERECWIPNRDWDQVCAYCSIVPDAPNYVFDVGEWSVELLLDGQLYSQAQFQVVN